MKLPFLSISSYSSFHFLSILKVGRMDIKSTPTAAPITWNGMLMLSIGKRKASFPFPFRSFIRNFR